VHTWAGVDKWQMALLLAMLLLLAFFKKPYPMLLLFFVIDTSHPKVFFHPDHNETVLVSMSVPISKKWNREYFNEIAATVLREIDRAVERNSRLIVFPESVLPVFLNREKTMLDRLKNSSAKIDIVLGALYYDQDRRENLNSTYFFHSGRWMVADKVVLVPFGERNPLPSWAGRVVNRIFFDGAPDYSAAARPTDFKIGGKLYRSAICYEGTSEIMYEDRPKRMILISNNGWFVPSTEPTLQRLLLEYYSSRYGTVIYHSANMSRSYIIVPERSKSILSSLSGQ